MPSEEVPLEARQSINLSGKSVISQSISIQNISRPSFQMIVVVRTKVIPTKVGQMTVVLIMKTVSGVAQEYLRVFMKLQKQIGSVQFSNPLHLHLIYKRPSSQQCLF